MELGSKVSWLPSQLNSAELIVAVVMGVAAFAQALTGFGFAVVSVGALSGLPWLSNSDLFDVITPVAATLGSVTGVLLLLPSVNRLAWDEILPLLVPCTLLTPVGIGLSSIVDPTVSKRALAILILCFVAYEVFELYFKPPPEASSDGNGAQDEAAADATGNALQSKNAALALGAVAGIFGGAFDVQGPPLVLYSSANRWAPRRARDNILTVVAINSASVVALDYFAQPALLENFYYPYFCLTSLPLVILGVAAGQAASERINPGLFANVVLLMCLGLGVQLLTLP